nr:hypothetical protein [Gemmatimonadales bacterium]
ALGAALRDSSARVREAAVTALGAVGGPGAAELAALAWRKDPSYEARAAALTALARLDPERASEAIAAGLETPSYREAIQNAAIRAALERPDPSFVGPLERIAGAQEMPAVALGVIAARGDAGAKAALARLLADDRPWVREWAREAIAREGGGTE